MGLFFIQVTGYFLRFPLPTPLLPSFPSDLFLIISSNIHLLNANYLYHVEPFPLPTLAYVSESSRHPRYFLTDAQQEL